MMDKSLLKQERNDLDSVDEEIKLEACVYGDSTKFHFEESSGPMNAITVCKTERTNSEDDCIKTLSECGEDTVNVKIENSDFVELRSINTDLPHCNKVVQCTSQPIKLPNLVESQRESDAAKKNRLKPKQKSYRKKVETLWSHNNIIKLIKNVEARRSLWDTNCAEYYKFQKELVWHEVANSIPESVNNCKGKWANLRITFGFNLKKYRREMAGRDTNKEPQIAWRYFKPMMFLDTTRLRQATQSVSSLPSESESRDDSLINNFVFNDDLASVLQCTNGQNFSQKSSPTASTAPSISGRNVDFKEAAVETLQYLRSSDTQLKETCMAFGEYIAAELSSLPPELSSIARAKMRRSFSDILDEVVLMAAHYKQHQ